MNPSSNFDALGDFLNGPIQYFEIYKIYVTFDILNKILQDHDDDDDDRLDLNESYFLLLTS